MYAFTDFFVACTHLHKTGKNYGNNGMNYLPMVFGWQMEFKFDFFFKNKLSIKFFSFKEKNTRNEQCHL